MKLNIIHLDMDAFYAAVEELDNPRLKGKPVIVGGSSNRGIVTTANYEARKYGVHSAMPIFMAKARCPHGVYLPTRKNRYSEVSRQVFDILYEVTDLIEPLSIDEAYLDISHIEMETIKVAEIIRKRVFDRVGLTMSIGISYNKFLAKIASDWNKPNGLTIIDKDMIPDILFPLSIGKVYGIGPKSEMKLKKIGIHTIEDLMVLSEVFLEELLGKSGKEIYQRIRGLDNRRVNPSRQRKSLGMERTFIATRDRKVLNQYLYNFSKEIEESLIRKNLRGKTITLKVKDEDFISHTRSLTINEYINSQPKIYNISQSLFDEITLNKKIRLIGLTISNLIDDEFVQLSFFD